MADYLNEALQGHFAVARKRLRYEFVITLPCAGLEAFKKSLTQCRSRCVVPVHCAIQLGSSIVFLALNLLNCSIFIKTYFAMYRF